MRAVSTSLLFVAALAGAGCEQGRSVKPQSDVYTIEVTELGFMPAETTIPAGRPVTLVIMRRTDATCAKEIVFPSLNQRYALPLCEPVKVRLAPQPKGSLNYVCGKNVYGGKLAVR